jgi:hypothetical protein
VYGGWWLSWFPELRRVETRAARRELWRAAFHPVLKSPTYWLIALVAQVGVQSIFRFAGVRCGHWVGIGHVVMTYAATGAGAAVAAGLTVWLVRNRLTRNLRRELIERGLPTCLVCGYDLTGNVSGTCPECGKGV